MKYFLPSYLRNIIAKLFAVAIICFSCYADYSEFLPGATKEGVIITPERGASDVIGLISNAKKEIVVSMYRIDHPPIIDALISAKKRGCNVSVIISPPRLMILFMTPTLYEIRLRSLYKTKMQ